MITGWSEQFPQFCVAKKVVCTVRKCEVNSPGPSGPSACRTPPPAVASLAFSASSPPCPVSPAAGYSESAEEFATVSAPLGLTECCKQSDSSY